MSCLQALVRIQLHSDECQKLRLDFVRDPKQLRIPMQVTRRHPHSLLSLVIRCVLFGPSLFQPGIDSTELVSRKGANCNERERSRPAADSQLLVTDTSAHHTDSFTWETHNKVPGSHQFVHNVDNSSPPLLAEPLRCPRFNKTPRICYNNSTTTT